MSTNLTNAWIIKIDGIGDHAVEDSVLDIVDGETPANEICVYVQSLCDLIFLTFGERKNIIADISSSNWRPYKVTMENTTEGPHITAGDNPFLLARKFNNIKINLDSASEKEIVCADGLEPSSVLRFKYNRIGG